MEKLIFELTVDCHSIRLYMIESRRVKREHQFGPYGVTSLNGTLFLAAQNKCVCARGVEGVWF